jgi:ubiquinone/menaquinone biosynthesis C-methylase UbiE
MMNAYQQTAALKAAIELDLFTAIGEGSVTAAELSVHMQASTRGVQALSDFLVTAGLLEKNDNRYRLTSDSAMFLSKKSPAYAGSATRFLGSPHLTRTYDNLADIVRSGRHQPDQGVLEESEHPAWVDFARSMGPLVHPIAEQTEKIVRSNSGIRVLDIAAGHGLFGIAVARHNPNAKIVAVDWPSVLAVAKENAERASVSDRYTLLPGDALNATLGSGFDVVLVPNFLHMWDRLTIQGLLKRVHNALAPKGRIVIVEFVPDENRISPPVPAAFALTMLVNTKGGNAYTASEYRDMLSEAGFSDSEVNPLLPTQHTAIVSTKR